MDEETAGCLNENKMDSWLKKKYIQVKIAEGGQVHVLSAVSSFAGLKMWKASKVVKLVVIIKLLVNWWYTHSSS